MKKIRREKDTTISLLSVQTFILWLAWICMGHLCISTHVTANTAKKTHQPVFVHARITNCWHRHVIKTGSQKDEKDLLYSTALQFLFLF